MRWTCSLDDGRHDSQLFDTLGQILFSSQGSVSVQALSSSADCEEILIMKTCQASWLIYLADSPNKGVY
jgi:hypothetical protein